MVGPEELERRAGRGASAPVRPSRPSSARARRAVGTGRARPVAAGVLVGALAVAWLVVGRGHSAGPGAAAGIAPPSSTSVPAASDALRLLLGDPPGCVAVPATVPRLRCRRGAIQLDVARYPSAARAADAYRVRVPVRPVAHAGGPQCATGHAEERSWSRPTAPARPVGRYDCTIERGRAAMWWTDDRGLFAHAVAPDGDLAALFRWWRAAPFG